MTVLLDTHALIWWFNEPSRLSRRASTIIGNSSNTILISAAVAWEMAIKVNSGKLDALELVTDLQQQIKREGFTDLPVNLEQAILAGLLSLHHRDPFDRLLVAQAQNMNIPILSADEALDLYEIERLW
jgi:PIN domain nuclease of toxin-antitoxin system